MRHNLGGLQLCSNVADWLRSKAVIWMVFRGWWSGMSFVKPNLLVIANVTVIWCYVLHGNITMTTYLAPIKWLICHFHPFPLYYCSRLHPGTTQTRNHPFGTKTCCFNLTAVARNPVRKSQSRPLVLSYGCYGLSFSMCLLIILRSSIQNHGTWKIPWNKPYKPYGKVMEKSHVVASHRPYWHRRPTSSSICSPCCVATRRASQGLSFLVVVMGDVKMKHIVFFC